MLPDTSSWHGLRKEPGMSALPYFYISLLSVTALIPAPEITHTELLPKSGVCRTGFHFPICSSWSWYTLMALLRMLSARNFCAILSMAVCPESIPLFPAVPMDTKKFSERLSHCMKQCKVNGAELSALSGVTAATISRYLNGLRTPTVENIILLAKALDVSVDYLLGLHDVPDDKTLTAAYSTASSADKRVIWTLLERYGGKHGTTTDR